MNWIGVCQASLIAAGLATTAETAPLQAGDQDEPQEQTPKFERLAMRIIALRDEGLVVVDRGEVDKLVVGDSVFFSPVFGGTFQGRITNVSERRASVQLNNRQLKLDVGTRGEMRIPLERFEEAASEPEGQAPPLALPGEHEGWERGDDGWTPDLPLLAKVEAIMPEKRPMRISGRAYLSGDHAWTSQAGRSDFFYRAGSDVLISNPFDRGGELHLDGEINYRHTDLPDDNPDESTKRLRIDRASYSWGGTRFDKKRQEVGRFIQNGVPEFGIVDGYEYGERLENGNRYGVSAGFMPEPTPQMETGNDLQVAGYYEWVSDKREELVATAGYQKSFHNGSADRDLLVGKMRYLPPESWDFNGTLWVDLYTKGDSNKSAPIGLTRALLSSGRGWEDGDSLTYTFVHQSFPEIDRFEFLPVAASQLANDRVDRVSASGWKMLAGGNRWHSHIGAWVDQDDAGGDLETGLELADFLWEGGRADLTVFGTQGAYSLVYGARAQVGGEILRARWDLAYEFSSHDLAGFDSDNDTIFQHRVTGDLDLYSMRDWTFSLNGTTVVWNSELSLRVGFYLQRSF